MAELAQHDLDEALPALEEAMKVSSQVHVDMPIQLLSVDCRIMSMNRGSGFIICT